jgi:type VI protein secretion system component Hcp
MQLRVNAGVPVHAEAAPSGSEKGETMLESLERRALLSTSVYLSLSGSSYSIPFFKLTGFDQTAPTANSVGRINFTATLNNASGKLLPAVQHNLKFDSANVDVVKTVNGQPQVTQALQFGNLLIHSIEWEGAFNKNVVERGVLSFKTSKAQTLPVPVPSVKSLSSATGPFDLVIPAKDSPENLDYRLDTFTLTQTPTGGSLDIKRPLDQSKADLSSLALASATLKNAKLYVHEGTDTAHEDQAFKLTSMHFSEVAYSGASSAIQESVGFSFGKSALEIKLGTTPAINDLPVASALPKLKFGLNLTNGSAHFNPVQDFQLDVIGKTRPAITLNITEQFTGTPKAGVIVKNEETFTTANLAFADPSKKRVLGEFFMRNAVISGVQRTHSGDTTTETFKVTAKTFAERLINGVPVSAGSLVTPPQLDPWNRIGDLLTNT